MSGKNSDFLSGATAGPMVMAEPESKFIESVARGAGYATGAAIAGAIVAAVIAPVPGSAELGAAIGGAFGGIIGGGDAAG